MDYDGWLPKASSSSVDPDARAVPWFTLLFPAYLSDRMIMTCREDPYWYRMANAKDSLDQPAVSEFTSYGLNSFMALSADGYLLNLDRCGPMRPLDNILVSDTGPDIHNGSASPDLLDGPSRNGGLLMLDDSADPVDGLPGGSWLTVRHGTGINALTIDGHVREISTKTLMESPVLSYYSNCAAGGCTLCTWNGSPVEHYSFAGDRLFWWTGSLPPPPSSR